MSCDISVFHSDELDDRALLPGADGWYIGAFIQNTNLLDAAGGPYGTEAAALDAMAHGAWLDLDPLYPAPTVNGARP
jgi:hypothetical protein